jgi:hypothetical protein
MTKGNLSNPYMRRLAAMQKAPVAATPPPPQQQKMQQPTAPSPLQALPRVVFDRLVCFLRWDSLIRLSGTNKYFNEFLTRQYPQEFFLVGPAFVPPPARNQEDNKKKSIESLHPIFHHLYFTHKMNPELVRVRDAFGQFLACLKVRNQFATRPAMTQLEIHIFASGDLGAIDKDGKEWNGVCVIQNRNGIKVMDLVIQLLKL